MPGLVDPDYLESVQALVYNSNVGMAQQIIKGEHVVQGLLIPRIGVQFIQGQLDETTKGDSGFGSTER